jgi:hypothetical protein
MKAINWIVTICAVAAAGCAVAQTPQPHTAIHQVKLQQDTVIQGYPCARGYASYYSGGRLASCGVSKETAFGEATLPERSILSLLEDGRPEGAMMAHDTVIAGVKCGGGNWLLGPSEGAATGFYPNGKLKICFLAGDQAVQGVPCMTAGFIGMFGDGARRDGGAQFYETGKLKSCTLTRDFASLHRGGHFVQAP